MGWSGDLNPGTWNAAALASKQSGNRKTRSAARKHEQMKCAPESHIPREIRYSKHLFFFPPFLLPCTHIGQFYNLYTTPRSVVPNTLGHPVSSHWKFCSHNKRITNTELHNHRFNFCFSAWELCLSYENGSYCRASLTLGSEGKHKQLGFLMKTELFTFYDL